MKYLTSFFLLPALILLIVAHGCKEKAASNNEKPAADTSASTSPIQSTVGKNTGTEFYGSVAIEEMRYLWENCDAIDIIFYETNFSMSQNEKATIQNTLYYFLPSPVGHNPDCKPIGRMTFMVKGEIRREVDIYISEGCQYFLWMENNKPVHINPMSPQGVTFFTEVLKKGKSQFD